MKSIYFRNTSKVIGTNKGFYSSKEIRNEPIFNAVRINKIKRSETCVILRTLLNTVEPLFESDKVIVLYMWKNFLLKNQTMIQSKWHFDYPYFPVDYPLYRDNFPRYKQLLNIVSDNKDGTSNTEFCINNITVNNLSNESTWNEIDSKLKVLSPKIFKCSDGEIIEYDSKTLHRASASLNIGLRLLMKIVFYEKEVYDGVKKIGFYQPSEACLS